MWRFLIYVLIVYLLQTPGRAHQRSGHPQRHVTHLQDHAWFCQVGYLRVLSLFQVFPNEFCSLMFCDILKFWAPACSLFRSALTLEDEKRSLALLIIGFIRMVRLFRPLLFQGSCFCFVFYIQHIPRNQPCFSPLLTTVWYRCFVWSRPGSNFNSM